MSLSKPRINSSTRRALVKKETSTTTTITIEKLKQPFSDNHNVNIDNIKHYDHDQNDHCNEIYNFNDSDNDVSYTKTPVTTMAMTTMQKQ